MLDYAQLIRHLGRLTVTTDPRGLSLMFRSVNTLEVGPVYRYARREHLLDVLPKLCPHLCPKVITPRFGSSCTFAHSLLR